MSGIKHSVSRALSASKLKVIIWKDLVFRVYIDKEYCDKYLETLWNLKDVDVVHTLCVKVRGEEVTLSLDIYNELSSTTCSLNEWKGILAHIKEEYLKCKAIDCH